MSGPVVPFRLIGLVAAPGRSARLPDRLPRLPHAVRTRSVILRSEGRPVRVGDRTVVLLGRLTGADHPDFEPAARPGVSERIVAELHERHGLELGRHLDGWFLALIIRPATGETAIANNDYTSGTCCFARTADGLYFADSVGRLLTALPERPALDRASLLNFLNCGFNHTERTCFLGVEKLMPGSALHYRDGALRLLPPEPIGFDRPVGADIRERIEEYDRLFAVETRAFLDAHRVRQAGGAISGGLDTSWTFHHLARAHDRPAHGFTVCYDHPRFDEFDHASRVMARCGGIHHRVAAGKADFELLPGLVELAGEPVLSVALPIHRMIRAAAGVVDGLVLGEGGNNIFSIYYPVAEAHRYLHRLPMPVRRGLHRGLDLAARVTGAGLPAAAAHVASIYAACPDELTGYFERLSSHYHFDTSMRDDLLDPALFGGMRMHRCRFEIPLRQATFFDDLIAQNIGQALKPYLLFFEHRMAVEGGIALSAPFVSRRIVRFAAGLPRDLVVGGGTLDRLLKRPRGERVLHRAALGRIFPPAHLDRPQQLFHAPYQTMFKARPRLAAALQEALGRRGWYQFRTVERLFADHRRQPEGVSSSPPFQSHGYRLMALLSLEVWARLFLDRRPRPDAAVPLEEFLA